METTIMKCPECGHEMVRRQACHNPEGSTLVYYVCKECGRLVEEIEE